MMVEISDPVRLRITTMKSPEARTNILARNTVAHMSRTLGQPVSVEDVARDRPEPGGLTLLAGRETLVGADLVRR